MIFQIIPAILAFLTTAYFLYHARQKSGQSKVFYTMVLIFLAHHLCEILAFVEFIKDGPQVIYQLKTYYIASLWLLLFILFYSQEVSKIKFPIINKSLIGIVTVTSLLILYGDTIVSGTTSLGYVVTAQKGPLYPLFQVSALTILFGTIVNLIYGYKKANDHLTEIQCIYMLIAFAPIVLISISIISLMAIGFKVNALAVVPIATTLFLIITMKSENVHKLTDIRRFMPFSAERKTSQEIMELYSKYARDEIAYRECINEIEKILVLQKYVKNGNNASATAETMGMPRSSLYSIFNRLSIDLKNK